MERLLLGLNSVLSYSHPVEKQVLKGNDQDLDDPWKARYLDFRVEI